MMRQSQAHLRPARVPGVGFLGEWNPTINEVTEERRADLQTVTDWLEAVLRGEQLEDLSGQSGHHVFRTTPNAPRTPSQN